MFAVMLLSFVAMGILSANGINVPSWTFLLLAGGIAFEIVIAIVHTSAVNKIKDLEEMWK